MSTSVVKHAVSKVFSRLIPFAMLLMFVNLIDRANISFVALQMNQQLRLTPAAYGLAASVFFLGYCVFEVPSNLILVRVGARRWLARIMISWGIVVMLMAQVEGTSSLYLARFALGIAEAGLLPGLVYYLSGWIPVSRRAVAFSALMSTAALSNFFGGPIATSLMRLTVAGLQGWQLVFIAEGIATVLIGIATLRLLPETFRDAHWLSEPERACLAQAQALDAAGKRLHGATSLWQGFSDRRVILGTVLNFFLICCNFGTVYWLPQIIKSLGNVTIQQVGFLACIPYGLGGIAMLLWGRHSDLTGDRRWHLFCGAAVGMAGYVLAACAGNPVLAFTGLCIATLGIWSTFGVFWAYAGDVLGGVAAAAGFAFMNAVSTLGGLVSPALIGLVRSHSAGFAASLLTLAALAMMAAISALTLPAGMHSRSGEDKAGIDR
jgi:ACS family tartrate transporter-like MFS transporter